jgi:hypothetical protein
MKLSLAFLAGVALTAGAVIWADGKPAGWFVAGIFTALVISGATLRTIGFARVGRFFTALDGALKSSPNESPRVATPGRRKKDNTRKSVVVQFPEVLSTVQQQVVSALVNLGSPMNKAQATVSEASKGRPGLDFDTLFRLCVTPASRSASA